MTPTNPEITTLSSAGLLIAGALRAHDCDPEPLFEQVEIDIRQIEDPNVRFPTTRVQALWRLAVEKTGNPCFGLVAADMFQPAALHGLGFAWLASDTLRDALGRLARYSRFINSFIEIRVEDCGDTADLIVTGTENWPDIEYAAVDAGMAIFLRMCRLTAGEDIDPAGVRLQRPAPACRDRFDAVFRAPVTFDAPCNRLCFHRDIIDQPLQTAHPELARINDQTVVDYLARFDRAAVSMQVRARIIEQLPDGTPQQSRVAEALHVSTRGLQRKLKDEATSFKSLLDETRRELALKYIRETYRSIGEITYLLGFSEPANFTRAFRRWTGVSPMEYRSDT